MPGAAVNIDGLDSLLRDLRRVNPEVRKELNREIAAAARDVRDEARRRAPVRSGRLRTSIRVGRQRGAFAAIKAGGKTIRGKDVAYARVVEFGGRHPLFGNRDAWFSNPARPFMRPAVEAKREAVARAVADAVDRAVKRAGVQ